MKTPALILLALFTGYATALTSGANFELEDVSVTEALEDIGVSVTRLPAPKPNLAAQGEGYTPTSCTLAVSAETNKRRGFTDLIQHLVQVSADPISRRPSLARELYSIRIFHCSLLVRSARRAEPNMRFQA